MKVKNLKIQGISGIDSLELSLNPRMNIICGPNGIGKTTILECIAHTFANGDISVIKRHARHTESKIEATIEHEGSDVTHITPIKEFSANIKEQVWGPANLGVFVLSVKTTRIFVYQQLDHISKDPSRELWQTAELTKGGVNFTDIKSWYVNRFLYSAHEGSLNDAQLKNLSLAKRCFSAINPEFSFSKVTAQDNEILVNTPSGEIYYEYLSSGFKSCISILFGIIKEIEYRFKPPIEAESFEGVILIDEIELHLHPEWQSRITKILLEIFPSCQFVVTTHSPHVVQAAEPDQILALELSENRTTARVVPTSDYGFRGWTLDEVLTDVMGMTDTRSTEFREMIRAFDTAVDNDDAGSALDAYQELDKSLHPNSPTRKILRLQLASVQAMQDD